MSFFQKKCFFDLENQEKRFVLCGQRIDFFPLQNQNCDQLKFVILISILNHFRNNKVVSILRKKLEIIEKNNLNIDEIFSKIIAFVDRSGYKIANLAVHMSLQKPKLCQENINYKFLIRDHLCEILDLNVEKLNVQAGTGEKIGDIGQSKAVIFISSVTLIRKNSKKNNEIIGFGYDRHRFKIRQNEVKNPVICGQEIRYHKNIDAHSDGDIVFHAIVNSIFSVIGAGDIGEHFPDTDPKWKNVSSIKFIEYALDLLRKKSFIIKKINITIVASINFQAELKKMDFLRPSQIELMGILGIKNKNHCKIKLITPKQKRANKDEAPIQNDLGIEAYVGMRFCN